MTQIADPYDEELGMPGEETRTLITSSPDPVVVALNRIAIAIERMAQGTSQPVQNEPRNLAPLPPVQVVAQKPACPYHGPDKVAPSTNGKGGFYCQAKPGIGQPNTNPKGFCTWHT